MDQLKIIFINNMEIIYFFYGLAFFIAGMIVLLHPKVREENEFITKIRLLGFFGLIHGLYEFAEMWIIIRGELFFLRILKQVILIISFFILFEFGRRLINKNLNYSSSFKMINRVTGPKWLSSLLILMIIVISLFSHDYLKTLNILTRYFLALPACLLISIKIFINYIPDIRLSNHIRLKRNFLALGLSFLFYGFFAGIITPPGNFIIAGFFNDNNFLNFVKIPVQFFRIICVLIYTWGIAGILRYEREQIESELKMHATIDEMTGVLNRRAGLLFLKEQMNLTKINKSRFSICFIDINGLKEVNDKYGHREGDWLIIKAINIIKETIKRSVKICRLGGDEFLLITSASEETEANDAVIKIQKKVDEVNSQRKKPYTINFSYGCAEYNSGSQLSLDDLLAIADKLMFKDKLRIKYDLKSMSNFVIGENAGRVWKMLNAQGRMNINVLKKHTGFDEKRLFLALGWLEREGKIKFEQEKELVTISLI